ncbi:MAG: hypothetical protein ABJA71_04425 [Ginsengibacter sp.]
MKKVLVLLYINGTKNPMLKLYIEALKKNGNYKILIVSLDGVDDNLHTSISVKALSNRFISYINKGVSFMYSTVASLFTYRKYSWRQHYDSSYYFLRHIAQIIQSLIYCFTFKPGLIICIDAAATNAARMYKKFSKVPYVYAIYEIYPDQAIRSHNSILRKLRIGIERYGVCKSSLLFSPISEVIGKFVNRRYKTNKPVCAVSICPELLAKQSTTEIELPLKLYYHGLFIDGRCLDSLIESMRHINPHEAQLYLRGFGPLEKTLINIVKENNLADKVTFLPPAPPDILSQLATEYDIGLTMGDTTILNNRMACGFKTLDNINAGLALLVPDGYVLNQLVTKYDIGKIYKTGQAVDIAMCIQSFVNDIDQVKQYKINSRELSREYLNKENQINIFLNEIGHLINN